MGLKKLVIDITALLASGGPADKIECEYLFHRGNPGAFSLLEMAEFAVTCRQCLEAFCVAACPKEALERQATGVVKRYNMRCVGCRSCVPARPFGEILPSGVHH